MESSFDLPQTLIESTRLYELYDINQVIVNLVFVEVSLVISILLVFWWQSAQSRFDHINVLLDNLYRHDIDKPVKDISRKHLIKQYEILIEKDQYNEESKGKFGLIILGSIVFLILILLMILVTLIIVCLEIFSEINNPLPIVYSKPYLIYTGILFITTFFSLIIINQIRNLAVHKSSSTKDIINYYIEVLEQNDNITITKTVKANVQKMKNNITTKHAMFLGAIAVIAFILAFGLGVAVNTLTGIPLTGGIINGIIVGSVITIGVKGANRFGSATIIWVVFAILAIPTTTFGFPGWYKPIVGFFSGLIWDILVFFIFNKSRNFLKYIVPAGFGAVAITIGVFMFMGWFGIPGYDRLKEFLPYLAPIYFLISAVGAWLGLILYKKYLSSNRYIQGLQ